MTTNAIKTDGKGPYFETDPRAELPVSFDWSAWLTAESTTIAASVWTCEPGPTLAAETNTTTRATVKVGPSPVGTYVLRNTITCSNGSKDSRSLRVVVKDR